MGKLVLKNLGGSMLRIAVVGVGKMGLSHLSTLRAHPLVDLVAICDQPGFILDVLEKYTGLKAYGDYTTMLDSENIDAVVIATPTTSHFGLVEDALQRGIHTFCEKPLTLSSMESSRLAQQASAAGIVTQVGYHNRFVGSFREVKRLLQAQAIGDISHVLAESYGPVVLRDKGRTWRSKRSSGGGCLYDYAAHPIDLLQWYLGEPLGVSGSRLNSIFSADTDDEVFSTFDYANGMTAHLSVNWSDEAHRKMTTKVSMWGKFGRIIADRQECRVFLSSSAQPVDGYCSGWNVKYTTELTEPVWFYLRGEEYSAEIDHFLTQVENAICGRGIHPINDFASARSVDHVIEHIIEDSVRSARTELIPLDINTQRHIEPEASKRPARWPWKRAQPLKAVK